MTDLYGLLGVDKRATMSEISTAYRNLAKVYHPDKFPKGDEQKFKEISEAYTILTNDEKRSIYDMEGIDGLRRQMSGTKPFSSCGRTFNVPADNDTFNSIFNQMFGQMKEATQIIHEVEIDLKELYTGCTKKVKFERNILCNICGINSRGCSKCDGKGFVNVLSEVDVDVCAGVSDNTQLEFDMGNEEPNKKKGKLLIWLKLNNKSKYVVDGVNLKITVDITLTEALNGVNKNIAFVDGSTICLTTKKGVVVRTNKAYIYKGFGMPVKGLCEYGDLYVYYNIYLPEKIPEGVKKQIDSIMKLI